MYSKDIYAKKNRYCVYLNRRKDNNEVFYVGQGTISRSSHTSGRSLKWHEIVNSCSGFYVEIIEENISKEMAIVLERLAIEKYKLTIVNKYNSDNPLELDFEELESLYYYDESSPSGLRWKVDRYSGMGYHIKSAEKDGVVGFIHFNKIENKKRWMVKNNGKSLVIHRIIWVLVNNEIDKTMVIDHIDNDPLNNNINNLRCIRQHINTRNRKKSIRNTTGRVGVKFRSMFSGKYTYYISQYHENGKLITKNFSIEKLGNDEAFKQACEWRMLAMEKLNDNGYEYTYTHCHGIMDTSKFS